eukprot:GILJ01023003.1.p1 GENE.GILJ01023003.1~~GILJ01023003.1.p1  ORF type:complete len:1422 (-),score=139.69 GILJ01023003.1:338-4078(-)
MEVSEAAESLWTELERLQFIDQFPSVWLVVYKLRAIAAATSLRCTVRTRMCWGFSLLRLKYEAERTLSQQHECVREKEFQLLACMSDVERNKADAATIARISRILRKSSCLRDLFAVVAQECPSLYEADSAQLFLYDNDREVLWSVDEYKKEVFVEKGVGIVGYTAATLEPIVLQDHQDEAQLDVVQHRESVLCVPLADEGQQLWGVLQFAKQELDWFHNYHRDSTASLQNELTCTISYLVANQASIQTLQTQVEAANRQSENLLKQVKQFIKMNVLWNNLASMGNAGISVVLRQVEDFVSEMAGVRLCSLFLASTTQSLLWTISQTGQYHSIPCSEGLTGRCMQKAVLLNERNVQTSRFFVPSIDSFLDKDLPVAMVCVPILQNPSSTNVIGVLRLFDRVDGIISAEKEAMLTTFVEHLSPYITLAISSARYFKYRTNSAPRGARNCFSFLSKATFARKCDSFRKLLLMQSRQLQRDSLKTNHQSRNGEKLALTILGKYVGLGMKNLGFDNLKRYWQLSRCTSEGVVVLETVLQRRQCSIGRHFFRRFVQYKTLESYQLVQHQQRAYAVSKLCCVLQPRLHTYYGTLLLGLKNAAIRIYMDIILSRRAFGTEQQQLINRVERVLTAKCSTQLQRSFNRLSKQNGAMTFLLPQRKQWMRFILTRQVLKLKRMAVCQLNVNVTAHITRLVERSRLQTVNIGIHTAERVLRNRLKHNKHLALRLLCSAAQRNSWVLERHQSKAYTASLLDHKEILLAFLLMSVSDAASAEFASDPYAEQLCEAVHKYGASLFQADYAVLFFRTDDSLWTCSTGTHQRRLSIPVSHTDLGGCLESQEIRFSAVPSELQFLITDRQISARTMIHFPLRLTMLPHRVFGILSLCSSLHGDAESRHSRASLVAVLESAFSLVQSRSSKALGQIPIASLTPFLSLPTCTSVRNLLRTLEQIFCRTFCSRIQAQVVPLSSFSSDLVDSLEAKGVVRSKLAVDENWGAIYIFCAGNESVEAPCVVCLLGTNTDLEIAPLSLLTVVGSVVTTTWLALRAQRRKLVHSLFVKFMYKAMRSSLHAWRTVWLEWSHQTEVLGQLQARAVEVEKESSLLVRTELHKCRQQTSELLLRLQQLETRNGNLDNALMFCQKTKQLVSRRAACHRLLYVAAQSGAMQRQAVLRMPFRLWRIQVSCLSLVQSAVSSYNVFSKCHKQARMQGAVVILNYTRQQRGNHLVKVAFQLLRSHKQPRFGSVRKVNRAKYDW